MKYTALIAIVLTLAACGGNAPASPPSVSPSSAPSSSATAGLSDAQGKSICHDINKWIPQAGSQDMPRFSAQLEADESQAGDTPLGQDMTLLDDNLQTDNGLALIANNYVVTGSPDPITGLFQDCQGYSVTLNWHQVLPSDAS